MGILVFNGHYDAYFWVLCVDKYCKVQGISENQKMTLAVEAMTGCALKWGRWWSPHHPGVSWNMFTIALLWRFKPEDRAVLPIVDEEEEPYQEISPWIEIDVCSHELMNDDILQAWDKFLLSTTEIEVPEENSMMEMVTLMNEFKGGIVELSEATPQQFNDMPQQFGDSKIIVENHSENSYDVVPQNNLVLLLNASLTTKKIDERAILREGEVSIWDSRISFNSKPVPKLIQSKSLQETLGFSTAAMHWFYYFADSNILIALPSPEPPDRVVVPMSPLSAPSYPYDPGPTYSTPLTNVSYSCHAQYLFVKMSLQTNFSFYTLKSLPCGMQIHAFFVPAYISVSSTLPTWTVMFLWNAKLCVAASDFLQYCGLALEFKFFDIVYTPPSHGSPSLKHVGSSCDVKSNFKMFCDGYEYFYYQLYASNFKRDINNVHRSYVMIEFVHGWEVYTSLSLNLCNTYAFCDAHKCCNFSDLILICSLIKCPQGCIFKIPLNYEDNHQVGFLKLSGLKISIIASTLDLVWVHDHHLLVFPPEHTRSKLIKNVDLMKSLFFTKEATILVTFLVYGERLLGYYFVGCFDKAMPNMLTMTCSDAVCSNCLRLWTYNNGIVQYCQIPINGLQEFKAKLSTIVEDYIEALIVQTIRVKYCVYYFLNSNLLDKDSCLDIFIGSPEGHCVVVLLPWLGLIPSVISHEYWEYWKNFYNLEDKVDLVGVDSDMIHVVWIPSVLAWIIHNEGTINDIKAMEIMEKTKHKKIIRLQYCCILLDGSLAAKIVALGVAKIDISGTNGCESMHTMVRHCGRTSQVRRRERKRWDPGRHLAMCRRVLPFKFKQWDPGKLCVVSNFYNLEDKVDFEGVGNVMILEAQIMLNPKVKGSGDSSTF